MATLRDLAPGYNPNAALVDTSRLRFEDTPTTPLVDVTPMERQIERNSMTQTGLGYKSSRLSDQANWMEVEAATREAAGDVQGAQAMRGQINGLRQQAAFYAPAEQDITQVGLNPGRILDYGLGAVGSMGASMQDSLLAGGAVRGAGALLKQSNNPLVKGAGLAAAFVPNLLSNSGEQLGQYREDPNIMANTTAGERLARGLGTGAVMGALDTIPEAGILSRVAGKGAGSILRNTALDTGKEMATEVAQTGVQKLDLGLLNPGRDSSNDWRDYANAAAQAGLGSAPLHGASNMLGAMGSRVREPGDPGMERGDEVNLRTGERTSAPDFETSLKQRSTPEWKQSKQAINDRWSMFEGKIEDFDVEDSEEAMAEWNAKRRDILLEELDKIGDDKAKEYANYLRTADFSDPIAMGDHEIKMDEAADYARGPAGMDPASIDKLIKRARKKNERLFAPQDHIELKGDQKSRAANVAGIIDTLASDKPADPDTDPESYKAQRSQFISRIGRELTAMGAIEREDTNADGKVTKPAREPSEGEIHRATRLGTIFGSMLRDKTEAAIKQITEAANIPNGKLMEAFMQHATMHSGKMTPATRMAFQQHKDEIVSRMLESVSPARARMLKEQHDIDIYDDDVAEHTAEALQQMFEGDDSLITMQKAVKLLGARTVADLKGFMGTVIGETTETTETDAFEQAAAEKNIDKAPRESVIYGRSSQGKGVPIKDLFTTGKMPALIDDDHPQADKEREKLLKEAARQDQVGPGFESRVVSVRELVEQEGLNPERRVNAMLQFIKKSTEGEDRTKPHIQHAEKISSAANTVFRLTKLDQTLTDVFGGWTFEQAGTAKKGTSPGGVAHSTVGVRRDKLTPNQRAALKGLEIDVKSLGGLLGEDHPALKPFTEAGAEAQRGSVNKALLKMHVGVVGKVGEEFLSKMPPDKLVELHKAVRETLEARREELRGLTGAMFGPDVNGAVPTTMVEMANRYFDNKSVVISEPVSLDKIPGVMTRGTFKQLVRDGQELVDVARKQGAAGNRTLFEAGMLYFTSPYKADEGKELAIKGKDLVAWVRNEEFTFTKDGKVPDYFGALTSGIAELQNQGFMTEMPFVRDADGVARRFTAPIDKHEAAAIRAQLIKAGTHENDARNISNTLIALKGVPAALMLEGKKTAGEVFGKFAWKDPTPASPRNLPNEALRDYIDSIRKHIELAREWEDAEYKREKYFMFPKDDDVDEVTKSQDERVHAQNENSIRDAARPLPPKYTIGEAIGKAGHIADGIWATYLKDPEAGMDRIRGLLRDLEPRRGGVRKADRWTTDGGWHHAAPLLALLTPERITKMEDVDKPIAKLALNKIAKVVYDGSQWTGTKKGSKRPPVISGPSLGKLVDLMGGPADADAKTVHKWLKEKASAWNARIEKQAAAERAKHDRNKAIKEERAAANEVGPRFAPVAQEADESVVAGVTINERVITKLEDELAGIESRLAEIQVTTRPIAEAHDALDAARDSAVFAHTDREAGKVPRTEGSTSSKPLTRAQLEAGRDAARAAHRAKVAEARAALKALVDKVGEAKLDALKKELSTLMARKREITDKIAALESTPIPSTLDLKAPNGTKEKKARPTSEDARMAKLSKPGYQAGKVEVTSFTRAEGAVEAPPPSKPVTRKARAERAAVESKQTMPMVFEDGTVWAGVKHVMAKGNEGQSTLELIYEGVRTATTRNTKPDVVVGDRITMDGKDRGTLDVVVTKAPYQLKWFGDARDTVNAAKWSKLEGWAPELYEHYAKKGAWQFQYELAPTDGVGTQPAPTTQVDTAPTQRSPKKAGLLKNPPTAPDKHQPKETAKLAGADLVIAPLSVKVGYAAALGAAAKAEGVLLGSTFGDLTGKVVVVSVPGKNRGFTGIDALIARVKKALDAGAKVRTDNKDNAERAWNAEGEGVLRQALLAAGYAEKTGEHYSQWTKPADRKLNSRTFSPEGIGDMTARDIMRTLRFKAAPEHVSSVTAKLLADPDQNALKFIRQSARALSYIMMSGEHAEAIRKALNTTGWRQVRSKAVNELVHMGGVSEKIATEESYRRIVERALEGELAIRSEAERSALAFIMQRAREFLSQLRRVVGGAEFLDVVRDALNKTVEAEANRQVRAGFRQVSFQAAVDAEPHAARVLAFISTIKDAMLTGSIVLSTVGTVYRKEGALLHDLDVVYFGNPDEAAAILKAKYPGTVQTNSFTTNGNRTDTFLVPPNGATVRNIVKNGGKLKSFEVVKDGKVIGRTWNDESGEHKSGESATIVDFMTGERRDRKPVATVPFTVEGKQHHISVSGADEIFSAKLAYAREKDMNDYAQFTPIHGRTLNERGFEGENQAQKAPDRVSQPTPSDADVRAVQAVLTRMLGPSIKVAYNKHLDAAGEWISGTKTVLIGRAAIGSVSNMLSVGYHEGMHAFFSEVLAEQPKVREMLESALNTDAVNQRLKELLAGEDAALAAIERSPEERVAYAFEFWTQGLLGPGPRATGIFERVQRFLRAVFTGISDQEKALEIFQALYDGKMAQPSSAARALHKAMTRGDKIKARKERMDSKLQWARSMALASHRVLTGEDTAVGKEIAYKFFKNPGSTKGGTDPGILNRTRNEMNRRQGVLVKIMAGLDEGERKHMAKLDNAKTDPATLPEGKVRTALEALYKFNGDMYRYLRDAGLDIGMRDDGRYTPMVWDLQYMVENEGKFTAMLMEHYRDKMEKAASTMPPIVLKEAEFDDKGKKTKAAETRPATAQDAANALHQMIIDRSGVDMKLDAQRDDGVLTPFFASENTRGLDWIAPEHRKEFLSEDLVHKMTGYIRQGVRAAEYTRTWGVGGKLLQDILQRQGDILGYKVNGDPIVAEKDGELITQLREAAVRAKVPDDKRRAWVETRFANMKRSVGAMEGVLGKDISDNMRRLNNGAMVYQNIRLLPLSLFAAMLDPNGIMVSGGSLNDALHAYVRGMKSVVKAWIALAKGNEITLDRDADETAAITIGSVDSQVFLERMGEAQTSEYIGGTARKINNKFFLLNGLSMWDRSMRIAATRAGMNFIIKHAGNWNEHSERFLKDLGLEAKDVVTDANGKLVIDANQLANIYARRAAGDGWAEATLEQKTNWVHARRRKAEADVARVHAAVNRFVERSILSPNAAQRPAWASDPHYAALFHLKQYTYSFQETIMQHVAEEAGHGNFTPGLQILAGVPIMIAADIVKGLVTGGGSLPGYMANWNLGDWFMHAWGRAGLNGVGQIGVDAVSQPSTLFGPSIDQLVQTIMHPIDKLSSLDMVPGARYLRPDLADLFDHADPA